RIDRGGNVLGVHGPVLRPTRIFYKRSICSCPADNNTSTHTSTSDQCRMHKIVISPLLARDIADCTSEFALHYNQRFVELASAVAARSNREVGDKIRQTDVQLPRRRIDSGIRQVDILMIVPTTECELDVPGSEVRQ